MNGVIIGRFMPPHNGHLYLIDFARHMVDTLYILVCTLSHEPIPGEVRYQWVRELAPTCTTIHITEEIPKRAAGAAGATAIWANTVRSASRIKFLTSLPRRSTAGTWRRSSTPALFRWIQAAPIYPFPQRRSAGIPLGTWRYIPPAVRPYFVKHVAVVDDAALTVRLATELETVVVHSYRDFWHRMWHARHGGSRGVKTPGTATRPIAADRAGRGDRARCQSYRNRPAAPRQTGCSSTTSRTAA